MTITAAGGARARGRAPWPRGLLYRYAGPVGAVAGGGALLLAFPPYGLWWLAPVGVGLLDLATHGRRVRDGAVSGLLFGAVFFIPLLSWTGLHTGLTPWLLLAGLQSAYIAVLGAASAFTATVVTRWRWSAPLVTGLLWVGQEALRDRTPFGGFPWGRLAFGQGDSPLLRLASLGGAPLVTFAVAVAGGLLAAAVRAAAASRGEATEGRGLRAVAAPVALAAALAGAAAVVPVAAPVGPRVNVAIVQGNVPRLGLDFNAQRRAVLDNHVTATIELARQVAAGSAPQPDLVVWPENASDIDPVGNADAGGRISQAADAIGAPILVGAVLQGPGERVRNAALVWLPRTGLADTYVKRHPVPFAEYVPLRSVARMVSSDVDRVRADFLAGDRPGVLQLGPARVSGVICFEVAYDDLVRDTVTGGAQLLTVQTNNATFNPAEAGQQLAMVQLRAVEHGREALMVSTVGISGFASPDGTLSELTGFDTREVKVRELTLATGRTLASRLGAGPEYVLVIAALALLMAAAGLRLRTRTIRRGTTTSAACPGGLPNEGEA